MIPLLLTLPWLALLAFLLFVLKLPRELPGPDVLIGTPTPRVSIIVPARNESVNIETCVASLSRSTYPDFEIIVVDDRSEDDTGARARSIPAGNADRILVLDGAELPEGWLGKPWACAQGAEAAQGDVLLFTDADTTHGVDLLSRSVAGVVEEEADLLTVLGRQLMGSFWERLVQPQVFFTMLFRFPDFEKTARNDNWRDAIANGQFIMMPRSSYERIGGHEAVFDEVVEDLALAQVVKRQGGALRIRSAHDDLATRMYRSLGELVAGWSKNIFTGGLQSVPRGIRPFMAPIAFLGGVGLWLLPPLVLLAAVAGLLGADMLLWASVVYGISVVTFGRFTRMMGASAAYGLLYPLGAAVGTFIFVKSWSGGRTVEWKGRRYELKDVADRA